MRTPVLTILRIAYLGCVLSLAATAAWYTLWKRRAPPVALVVFFVLLGAGLVWPTWPVYRVAQKRHAVFHHTDHGAVLAACRELMREADEPWTAASREDPAFERLPAAIRDLRPLAVSVRRDRVVIALGGGWFPFDLYAYPPGSPGEGGTGRIIGGLCFYAY